MLPPLPPPQLEEAGHRGTRASPSLTFQSSTCGVCLGSGSRTQEVRRRTPSSAAPIRPTSRVGTSTSSGHKVLRPHSLLARPLPSVLLCGQRDLPPAAEVLDLYVSAHLLQASVCGLGSRYLCTWPSSPRPPRTLWGALSWAVEEARPLCGVLPPLP